MTPSMTLTLTADSPLIQSLREEIVRRVGTMAEELKLLRKLENVVRLASQHEQAVCDHRVQAALDDIVAWRKEHNS